MKQCSKCQQSKPRDAFSKATEAKDGLQSRCRECNSAYHAANRDRIAAGAKARYEANHGERKQDLKDRHLTTYWPDCTPDEARGRYAAMLIAQHYACALCSRHKTSFSKALFVDHCHETGAVRGLLCNDCNTAIGRLGDNAAGLQKALSYLTKPTQLTKDA